jgi:hypothetical protein
MRVELIHAICRSLQAGSIIVVGAKSFFFKPEKDGTAAPAAAST